MQQESNTSNLTIIKSLYSSLLTDQEKVEFDNWKQKLEAPKLEVQKMQPKKQHFKYTRSYWYHLFINDKRFYKVS